MNTGVRFNSPWTICFLFFLFFYGLLVLMSLLVALQVANVPVQLRIQEMVKVEKKKKMEVSINDIAMGELSLQPLLSGITEFETEVTAVRDCTA